MRPELNLEKALVSARCRRKKQTSRQRKLCTKECGDLGQPSAAVKFAVFRA